MPTIYDEVALFMAKFQTPKNRRPDRFAAVYCPDLWIDRVFAKFMDRC